MVRSAEDRRAALIGVGMAALELGASVLGYASSGLPGPKGNLETFIWCYPRRDVMALQAGPDQLEPWPREVEP